MKLFSARRAMEILFLLAMLVFAGCTVRPEGNVAVIAPEGSEDTSPASAFDRQEAAPEVRAGAGVQEEVQSESGADGIPQPTTDPVPSASPEPEKETPETETPEAETPEPETETETAEPQMETPEPEAETPEPEAETQEPEAETPEQKSEPEGISGLETKITELISGYSGTWSVYCKRLDTGESFCIHDEAMTAASLIKLYVYGAVRYKIEFEGLPDVYDEALWNMITVSDNTACNTLIDAVGGIEEVNRFIEYQGDMTSRLNRKMLAAGPENLISTRACGELLEQVWNGADVLPETSEEEQEGKKPYVSPETSKNLLYALENQTRRTKIPAVIPGNVTVANKTGELEHVQNDAAIVYSPACAYILCVQSENVGYEAIGRIAEISKEVFAYFNRQSEQS